MGGGCIWGSLHNAPLIGARLRPTRRATRLFVLTPSAVNWFYMYIARRVGCRDPQWVSARESRNLLIRLKAEPGGARPDGIGDIARGEVAIVHLDHAGVAMAKVLRHHHQRDAGHGREARPGMAQAVEVDLWRDLRTLAGSGHQQGLL